MQISVKDSLKCADWSSNPKRTLNVTPDLYSTQCYIAGDTSFEHKHRLLSNKFAVSSLQH